MRTYDCACGAKLFFGNTHCASCRRDVGWCDACRTVTSVSAAGTCEREACRQPLAACYNRRTYSVCNVFVPASSGEGALCRSCRKTIVIPDTSQPQQVARWGALEEGKRRLLYDLQLVGLTDSDLEAEPPLRFRFMADTPGERIVTGHQSGLITINLAEADPVVRERGRQKFDEPHRTIIGHLRHEVCHFLWLRLVKGQREDDFQELFGDHNHPDYQQALGRYYDQGPPENWTDRFISQYASSHPWEDFAETAAFYLDMCSVLDTLACGVPALAAPASADFDGRLQAYLKAGIALNEINRSMGLTDLVPEVVSDVVVDKLRFVQQLLPCGADQ